MNKLIQALEIIREWNSHTSEYAVDYGSNGVRDFYRAIAGQALSEQSTQQEPVALQMDVIVVNLVREGINKHRAREMAEHFIKHTSPQPAQRKPLTERELMKCITQAKCFDTVKMTYESGPYEIDRPTLKAFEFARAIEAHHGIKE